MRESRAVGGFLACRVIVVEVVFGEGGCWIDYFSFSRFVYTCILVRFTLG